MRPVSAQFTIAHALTLAAWLLVVVALAASGCDHKPAAPPAPPTPSAAPVADAVPAPPSEAAQGEAERAALMKDHFDQASQARDAVLRGQLDKAEAPLLWLGQHGFSKQAPAAWQPHLAQMQRAARQASNELTLSSAAQAIGTLASECGACHTALGQGPRFAPSDLTDLEETEDAPKKARAVLQDRMHVQTWAVERLWEGLVGPWDKAWEQGALSLAELTEHPRLPARLRPQLVAVRALGPAALVAKGQVERAELFGKLIAACGGCHASLGVDPGVEQPVQPPAAQER